MFYGVARLEFLIPHSQSLKEKRAVINRLKARLQSRYHVAVAEVDHQDLRQRGALGLALVAQGPSSAQNGLSALRRLADEELRISVIDFTTHVGALGDQMPREAGSGDSGHLPFPDGPDAGARETGEAGTGDEDDLTWREERD